MPPGCLLLRPISVITETARRVSEAAAGFSAGARTPATCQPVQMVGTRPHPPLGELMRVERQAAPPAQKRRGRVAHHITRLCPQGWRVLPPLWDGAFSHAHRVGARKFSDD
jgi:hypothetical protein